MKTLLIETKTAVVATLLFAVLLCVIYPLAVWAPAQWLMPEKANGSLVYDADGTLRGSRLIGQPFASPGCFHPRPSAAGSGYDGAGSGGTNLGPTSRKLSEAIAEAIKAYRSENKLPETVAVPADAVTSSGSGLDPHISTENARLQAPRVSKARGLSLEAVQALIAANTTPRDLGVLGEPGVNVLLLNRALDTVSRDLK